MDTTRSPAQHRAILDAWRAENEGVLDSEILNAPRTSERSRHREHAQKLSGVLSWRALKETPSSPLRSNYLHAGLFDFNDDAIGETEETREPAFGIDSILEDRPSLLDIYRSFKGVRWTIRKDGQKVPCAGNFSHATNQPYAPIERIGRLRFATEEGSVDYPYGSITSWINPRNGRWEKPSCTYRKAKGSIRGESPPNFQQPDILDMLENAETLQIANDNLAREDIATLDLAMTATSFKQIGETFSHSGKTAERQGKRLVLRAAKNFDNLLKKHAA